MVTALVSALTHVLASTGLWSSSPRTGPDYTCNWYHADVATRTNTLCDTSSYRRAMSSLDDFVARARLCTTTYGISCVMSHEVDFSYPAYYYANTTTSEQIVLMPQVKHILNEPNVTVMHVDPDNPHTSSGRIQLDLKRRVEVEYVDPGAMAVTQRVAVGGEAYCAQMLARSVPDECQLTYT